MGPTPNGGAQATVACEYTADEAKAMASDRPGQFRAEQGSAAALQEANSDGAAPLERNGITRGQRLCRRRPEFLMGN